MTFAIDSRHRKGLYQISKSRRIHHLVRDECSDKGHILLSSGDQLTHRQVMDLQTPSRLVVGILIANHDKAVFPAGGEHRRFRPYPMHVKAVQLVKGGSLAEGSIDLLRLLGIKAGYMSTSWDFRNTAGAEGNWPRMAWLPRMMKSSISVTLPAARMACSSSIRCIFFDENQSLFLGNEGWASERCRLAHGGRLLA